jgi:CRISPR system Cascade subunit CasD
MANTLFLWLEGPMQSWGERARWSVRDSASEPTKSAVIGLLGCALGISDDVSLREISQNLRMGVACDRPGVLQIDYHTVGGGYDAPALLTAEGRPKLSSGRPHTEQTWRHYLWDAAFLIALQGPPGLVARLAQAVQSPYWPFYLGRKCCIPTRPPFAGLGDYDDLIDALLGWHSEQSIVDRTLQLPDRIRAVLECPSSHEGAVRRRDEIASRERRTFAPRYTRDVWLDLNIQEVT